MGKGLEVSKVFEKLVNNRIVDQLKKSGLFSDFRYRFRSSKSTADLLTVVSGRIARAFMNLNLISKTLWIGLRSGLLISKLGKLSWLFDQSNNNGSINVKMDGSAFEEKSYFKMLGLTFSSKLDWGSYIISIVKTASKKIEVLICSMMFLFPEVVLYLYISTIHPCIEYCCHIWAGVPSCYLELLDKLQKRICKIVGPSPAASLKPLAYCWNVANLSLFYRYYFGRSSSELAQLVLLPFSQGRSTCFSDRLHDFSVTIPNVTRMSCQQFFSYRLLSFDLWS